MNDRDIVLASLPEPTGEARAQAKKTNAKSVPTDDLWTCFVERLAELGGEVKRLEDLAEFRDRVVCDYDVPADVRRDLGIPQDDPWLAEVGVTLADMAVAETGSVLISAGNGRRRLASLAPPIHAVLVKSGSIVASLDECILNLPEPNSVLITGPSKTADIEGVMVMGAHGPKRLWIIRLPDPEF